jgi:hypothetical protein
MDYFNQDPRSDNVDAYPSASAVVFGQYAYLFALYEHGTRPLLVTRLPLNGLNMPESQLQYLDRNGSWKMGFDHTSSP